MKTCVFAPRAQYFFMFSGFFGSMRLVIASFCALLGWVALAPATTARAQSRPPGPASAPALEQGAPVRAPEEAGVTGRDLRLNGLHGRMRIERRGADLVLARLTLAGERATRRGEACEAEVSDGALALKPLRRHEGLRRYEASLPGCSIALDLLAGAVQASVADVHAGAAQAGACLLKSADCKVVVAGVWGPPDEAIGEAEIARIERARAAAERNAMANYRALVAAAGKDRDKVRVAAAEQAGFSSRRSEHCGDYAGEERHGFCASRVTEAWAVALRARLNPDSFEAEEAVAAARRPGARAAAAR
jgi:hypothetical protein